MRWEPSNHTFETAKATLLSEFLTFLMLESEHKTLEPVNVHIIYCHTDDSRQDFKLSTQTSLSVPFILSQKNNIFGGGVED